MCLWYTGWVLDYQTPDKENEYPTTWYIVTNTQVVSNFRFGDNPYNQILPHDEIETKRLRSGKYSILKSHKNVALYERRENCKSPQKYRYLDMNISRNANFGLINQGIMEEPKLFFSAFNFLDQKKSGVDYDHWADFVVLELKFKGQDSARLVTGNFAEKYPVKPKKILLTFLKNL